MAPPLVRTLQRGPGIRQSSQITQKKSRTTRTSRSKVKSGCRTCKLRRVKCGEEFPACQRCLSTGRVCDGYGIWGGGGNAYGSVSREYNICGPRSLTRFNTPVPLHEATAEEKICFDFFRRRTALKLPGVFESNFWESLIFQASSTEPAVLHAAIALASAHRSEEMSNCESGRAGLLSLKIKDNGSMNVHDRFALQQYNKAINHLQMHFSTKDKKSLRVTLITCMMFICLELLRGEFKTVSTHLQNGLNLLSQVQGRRQDTDTVVVRPEPESVDDNLIEAFARLNVQSALFGLGSQHLFIIAQDLKGGPDFQIPRKFSNVYETRQYLDGLLNAVFHLVEQSRNLPPALAPTTATLIDEQSRNLPPTLVSTTALIDRHSHLQTSLSAWLNTYECSLSSFIPNLTPRTALGLPLLRIYHTMTTIMLSTSISAYEEDFDSHILSFDSIITQCTNLASLADLPVTYTSSEFCEGGHIYFTVDMGFIPPLYYTALKCREPAIRRAAIKLLLAAPHREGMWDPSVIGHVALRVMEIEEGVSSGDLVIKYDATPLYKVTEAQSQSSERKNLPLLDSKSLDMVREVQSQVRERTNLPLLSEAARFREVKVLMSEEVKGAGTLICRRCRYEGDGGWEVREEEFDFSDMRIH